MKFVWKNNTGVPIQLYINNFCLEQADLVKVVLPTYEVEIELPELVTHTIIHQFHWDHVRGKMVLLLERRVMDGKKLKITRVRMDGTEERL